MLTLSTPEIRFGLDAVRQAALLVRQVQSELVSQALTKDDCSPVTVADFASQALIGHMLAKAFPNDLLVAEEDSTSLRGSEVPGMLAQVTHFIGSRVPGATDQDVCSWIDQGQVDTAPRFWTLDPIDGTKGFLRGDQYVVALALIEGGQVQVGILGCPNLVNGRSIDKNGPGSLVIAVRGQGTWTTPLSTLGDFERLHVSDQDDPSQVRVLSSFESGHTNMSQIDNFVERMDILTQPVRLDSQAKYALLAAGKGELYLRLLSSSRPDYREKVWDQAAGSLVLSEAGGRITDLNGTPLDFTAGRTLAHNRGILASNGLIHDLALEALAFVGA
jgi:3'(2'), 5'-bisphosphate nucleotidase